MSIACAAVPSDKSRKDKAMKKQENCLEKTVASLNGAVIGLEGLTKTEDFSPLTGIVDEIAGLAGRKFDESEDSKLMVCFSEAVARLHNAVFDREGAMLFALRNEYEKWVPLTQCEFAKGSRSVKHRMKGLILSLQHKADEVESAPKMEARAMVVDLLVLATRCYERFRSGYRLDSSQFVFCYLHLLAEIATAARRLGGEKGSPLGIKEIVGFSHEDVCWFEMPDTPKDGDEDGCEQFVVSSISEMDKWSRMVCAARPEPFLANLHQLTKCAATCVMESVRIRPESERRMFSALARTMDMIHTRIDSDCDLMDCVLGHLTVPIGDSSWYSYSEVVDRMCRLAQQCLKARDSRAKVLLPRHFCECTRLLSYAFNFEWEKRWQLMELYDKLQSDMWGLAKKLAGGCRN